MISAFYCYTLGWESGTLKFPINIYLMFSSTFSLNDYVMLYIYSCYTAFSSVIPQGFHNRVYKHFVIFAN